MDTEFSYLSTPRSTGLCSYKTVIDVFKETASKNPEKEILIHRGIDGSRDSLTFQTLEQEASRLARYLVSRGIQKGDKVALFGPNTLEWVVGEFAIIMAGGVVVHVSISVADVHDVWDIFSRADCRAFLIDPGKGDLYLESIFSLLALFRKRRPSQHYQDTDSKTPTVVFLRNVEDDKTYADLQSILKLENLQVELPTLFPEDHILVFTTSGSTGKPKMVSHTHFDLINALSVGSVDRSDDKLYNDRPFGWAGGSPVQHVIQGNSRVFTDASVAIEGRSTEKVWDIIRKENCSTAMLMPYFLSDLIDIKDSYDWSFKVKAIMTGGQMIDNYYTQVVGVFTESLNVIYGSTEAGVVTHGKPIFEGDYLQIGDVGEPAADTEVKIIDDSGNVTFREQVGELCIRSRVLFHGYLMNQEASKRVFLDGNWYRTGDTGYITKDGRIIIAGRVKDIISRGTRKIMPDAIEDAILQMNNILHIAIVPVPDARLYEEVCACYVPKNGTVVQPHDVEEFCKEIFVTQSSPDGLGEMPKYFLCFDEFPLLLTGKPNKRKIRTEALARLNLSNK